MIGVSADYDVKKGTEYLADSPFSEIVVGRGFLNSGSSLFLLGQEDRALVVPQIVVFDRQVQIDSTSISLGSMKLVKRMMGSAAIHEWISNGARM